MNFKEISVIMGFNGLAGAPKNKLKWKKFDKNGKTIKKIETFKSIEISISSAFKCVMFTKHLFACRCTKNHARVYFHVCDCVCECVAPQKAQIRLL